MNHIQIPTYYNGFFLAKFLAMSLEALVILFDSIIESIEFLSGIWDISSDEVEFTELHSQHSALLRVFGLWQILLDADWHIFGKNSNPRITLRNFTKIPISMISLELQFFIVGIESCFINFSFANTYDIWFMRSKIFGKILLVNDGSNSIDIP